MLKFLIIDDSKSVHAFVGHCLEKFNIEINHVYDGSQGVEWLKQAKDKPDLIFLDWEMPVMDGPTTLEKIKSMGIQSPVVMMTSKNAPDDIARMLDAGACEYIIKPFTSDILVSKIESILGIGLDNAA